MTTVNCSMECSQSVARSVVKRAISELGWQIEEELGNIITASTPFSLESWGGNVEVRISSKSGQTHVSITSNPKLQIFDWGKSEENVKALLDKMSEL